MDSSTTVLTVSALNSTVAKILEHSLPLLWISGEISNFTKATSGHWYFTLKDNSSQVRAIMFRGRTQSTGFTPKDGDKVEVRATVTLYTARGDFQLNVETIRQAGVGNLFETFLRLKARLNAEGLFDSEKKRSLPVFVHTIGIITSPKAAALRDILTTLTRRAPHVNLILYPVPVQGQGAAEKIAQAISTASLRAECDILLICRGGGSIEDLWNFNEEVVARSIAACLIPTISGIGHETDITIADFVADARAPTPTGAAEIATRARQDWIDMIEIHASDLRYAMKRILQNNMQNTDLLAHRLISPAAYIERERIKIQALTTNLTHVKNNLLITLKYELSHLATRFKTKLPDTQSFRTQLLTQSHQLNSGINTQLMRYKQMMLSLATQLELLSPDRTLERGYAILTDKQGHIIRSPQHIPVHKPISVRLASGSAKISIETVQPDLN